MKRRRLFRARLPRKILATALTLALAGGMQGWRQIATAADPSPATQPATGREGIVELERLFDALEAADRQSPADSYDPAAVVSRVGREPGALFAWVRDQTTFAPYQGALRGPVGVLMDRLGSSLDRSLLLARLLREAGHTARLAHANLPPEKAADLLKKVRPIAPPAAPNEPAGNQDLDRLATQFGLNADQLRAGATGPAAEADRLLEDVAERSANVLPVVSAALPAAAPAPADAAAQPLAALSDHWWVQVQQGGQWTDLDPLLPDAKPGQSLAPADKTIEPAALAAEQWHRLTLRVVIEQSAGGKLTQTPVLSRDLRPADLVGKPITFSHIPLNWPANVTDGPAWIAAAGKQHEWLPQLAIGDQTFAAASFDDTGTINKSPQPDPMARLGKGIGNALGGFGALGGGGDEPAGKSVLTAEWLEYDIQQPGRPAQTIRREIFDLLGPADRAKGTAPTAPWTDRRRLEVGCHLADQIEILPQVCRLSPDFTSHLVTQAMLANRDGLVDYFRQRANGQPAQPHNLTPSPGELYALALGRGRMGNFAGDIYLDRLNVLTHHFFPTMDGSAVVVRGGFDIVCNEVAVRPGSATDAYHVRLARGVVDTVLEDALAGDGRHVGNTSSALLADLAAGREWITVRAASDPAWKKATVPAATRARIEQDLSAGYVVVVPTNLPGNVEPAWWRIDPKTGQSLGMAGPGWGAAMLEYATNVAHIASTVLCMIQYHSVGGQILCIVGSTLGGRAALLSKASRDLLLYIIGLAIAHLSNYFG